MLDAVSLVVGYAGGVLTVLVASWGVGRGVNETDHAAAQRASERSVWTCTCGQRFGARQDAKDHARETHNAPVEDDEWVFLMDATTDQE